VTVYLSHIKFADRGGFKLSIIYKCRHCGHTIGSLTQQVVTTSMLGWDKLSSQDQKRMIQYKNNGDVHIQAICESCETSLAMHPDYYELEYFLH